MHSETIAVHSGYEIEPSTKAGAVPIYQTVAYAFDTAKHGAALFSLEVEGHRYGRISNPPLLCSNGAFSALEGGLEALCVSARGNPPCTMRRSTLPSLGTNIVSVPQLYGTTHTLFVCRALG